MLCDICRISCKNLVGLMMSLDVKGRLCRTHNRAASGRMPHLQRPEWFRYNKRSSLEQLSSYNYSCIYHTTYNAFPTLHFLFKSHYLTQSSHRISSLVSGIISLVSSNATIVLRHHCDVKFVDIQNISVRFFLL